jgi:hypothetical protein
VFGINSATSGYAAGVYGESSSPEGNAVSGANSATTGNAIGVTGTSASPTGTGVYGSVNAPTGNAVVGINSATSGYGAGLSGTSSSPAGSAVVGTNAATTGNAIGVTGTSLSPAGTGVFGSANAPTGNAVIGINRATTGSGAGVEGVSASPAGAGIHGGNSGGGLAGLFNGNVSVSGSLYVAGTITKGSGSFMIDHPLDPENKYLFHSFVESPDMKNIYDGVAVLGDDGGATIELPDWFEALNRDFRYQLTCLGAFAPMYVADEIQANHFRIAGGRVGMKISWQVTGIPKDAYANAHRILVEEPKQGEERGRYLEPALFGQPEDRRIGTIPGNVARK